VSMARVLFLLLLLLPLPSGAVEPDEILDDPALEARARELSKEIRCVVCQNESIDSSNAGIARDLRILVRDRLTAGDSDREVKDFLVARYGDYVLLKPPVKPKTWALWFGPAIILLIGGLATAVFLMRRPRQPAAGTPSLSEAEQARLETLLKDDPPK
jgi:cytochrome c-type biogenesis protein CcmH